MSTTYGQPAKKPYVMADELKRILEASGYYGEGNWELLSTTNHTVLSQGSYIVKAYNYCPDRLHIENHMNNLMGITSGIITEKNGGVLVMKNCGEPLEGISFTGIVKAGHLLQKIHETPLTGLDFPKMYPYLEIEQMMGYLKQDNNQANETSVSWIIKQCCAHQEHLAAIPREGYTLTHGDAHLFNIVKDEWSNYKYIDFEGACITSPLVDYGAIIYSVAIDNRHWGISVPQAIEALGFDHLTDELYGGVMFNLLTSSRHYLETFGAKSFQARLIPRFNKAVELLENCR